MPRLRYESVGRGFESLPSHQKSHEIERFHGFFVFEAEVAHTCTLSARFVFSVSETVGRPIAAQSAPFFASGEQCQTEFCLPFELGVEEVLRFPTVAFPA